MRLIDEDELILHLNDFMLQQSPIDAQDIESIKVCAVIQDCIKAIENQPTAYDIDKVVVELEKNASRYTKKYTTPYGNNGYRDVKAISIHKAIEIVKHGGVVEEVNK